jgi:hypothetical protein
MIIANPIYAVVFKYMMEDNRVARKFISVIIGEEVTELDFANREVAVETDAGEPSQKEEESALEISGGDAASDGSLEAQSKKGKLIIFKLLRLDFVAKIRTPEGYKSVIIEMQKTSNLTDIMRFRRYVGSQYRSMENSYEDASGRTHAREIYCIFFLGDGLQIKDVPVLVVSNTVHDHATGERLEVRNEFISCLHHRSWIIQIPCIPKRRRNDLEILLGIFDPEKVFDNNHLLDINDEDFPEEYRPIIRRLASAVKVSNMLASMEFEDDLLMRDRDKDCIIKEHEKAFAREHEEKEKALAEVEKERAEKDRERAEKDRERAEKDRERAENEKARAEIEKERVEKEKERVEKEKERAEKEKARAENEKARAEIDRERTEKEKERAGKEKALAEIAELKRLLANQ